MQKASRVKLAGFLSISATFGGCETRSGSVYRFRISTSDVRPSYRLSKPNNPNRGLSHVEQGEHIQAEKGQDRESYQYEQGDQFAIILCLQRTE